MVVYTQLPSLRHSMKQSPGVQLQINSVAVSPDLKRFATAGADFCIRLWNFKSVTESGTSKDGIDDIALSSMHNDSAVQCLRWSPNSDFLASGDDIAMVKIWVNRALIRPADADNTFRFAHGTDNEAELWKCIATFRSHSADVTGLAWSPDSTLLASCSIDNTVKVWPVDQNLRDRELATILTEPAKTLKRHNGWVKDVSWDPIGRYLASVSDDKSVVVWRCSDWRLEAHIKEPFVNSSGCTMRRQLTWSPDGVYLCVSHAFDEPRHVAFVIERNNWFDVKKAVRLVGHMSPVSLACFSPAIYKRANHKQNGVTVVAIADDKATVTIWSPGRNRPIVVCRNVFKKQILDMGWSSDGRFLVMCSVDGSVSCLDCADFVAHPAVGTPLSCEEIHSLRRKYYGDVTLHQVEPSIAETLTQFQLEQQNAGRKEANDSEGLSENIETSNIAGLSIATEGEIAKKQVESRTLGGKRRISPVSLSQVAIPSLPQNGIPATDQIMSSSNATLDRQQLFSDLKTQQKSFMSLNGSSKTEVEGETHFSLNPTVIVVPSKSPVKQSRLGSDFVLKRSRLPRRAQMSILREDGDSKWLRILTKRSKTGSKSWETSVDMLHNGCLLWNVIVPGKLCSAAGNSCFTVVGTRQSELHIFSSESGRLLLPSIQLPLPIACLAIGGVHSPFLCCATCDASIRVWDLERLVCIVSQAYLDPLKFCILKSDQSSDSQHEDGKVNKRRGISLQSGIRASYLALRSKYGSSSDSVSLEGHDNRDNSDHESLSSEESEDDISAEDKEGGSINRANLTCLSLSASGVPVLLLTRGMLPSEFAPQNDIRGGMSAVFAYSIEMAAWMRVADATRYQTSDFFSTLSPETINSLPGRKEVAEDRDIASIGSGLLTAFQDIASSAGAKARIGVAAPSAKAAYLFNLAKDMESSEPAREKQRLASKMHLESLVASAALLQTREEFVNWFKVYVNRLVDNSDVSCLRSICESLTGPNPSDSIRSEMISTIQNELGMGTQSIDGGGRGPTWSPKIMGSVCKKTLLNELVIPAMAKNRVLQSLVVEFSESPSTTESCRSPKKARLVSDT